MGIAGAIGVAYHLQPFGQWLMHRYRLCCPIAMQMGEPHIALTNSEVTAIEALEDNIFLLAVLDLGPCLNNVHLLVRAIAHAHFYRIGSIVHTNGGLHAVG